MEKLFEYVANASIKYDLRLLYKIFFIIFKFFLRKKIILKFSECKFFAYPQKKELSRWMIRNLKIWEEKMINIIIKNIKKNDSIFIDIGCNYGAYSIPVSKTNSNLNVYCFDPSKKSLKRLVENINLNNLKNIKYFELGIGEVRKSVFFDDDLINYKNSGSYQINNKNIGYKINIDSIDNLIERNEIQPRENIFIKMDIEGYEFFALKGLVNTITKYNVMIFFEFSKKIFENHKFLKKEFIEFININNLKIYDIDFIELKPEELFLNIKNIKKNHDVLGNFILYKKAINEKA